MLDYYSLELRYSELSEVLNRAEQEAQIITRRDRQYVVLDGDQYRRLTGDTPSLKDLILNGPSLEGVDLERDPSPSREFDLWASKSLQWMA